ncbi:ABC transporter permease [Pontibacter sp. 13R65]|uniref:ABC transporter permease n=1 Tax=Pontibacter sp. 13R65 TaxID=3127458 RepID=UPI00301DE1C9
MAAFLLRRLFYGLLALWLISTLIFLLSRFLPGSFAAQSILKENDSFYNTGSIESRQAAYQSYLRRTRLDLPLFYFSISSSAQPDTAIQLLQESDKLLLQQLSWHYGNPKLATEYFRNLKNLIKRAGPQAQSEVRVHIQELLQTTDAAKIKKSAAALQQLLGSSTESFQLQQTAEALIYSKQQWKTLLPRFSWHGGRNQFHQWLSQLFQGNLGNSYRDNSSVLDLVLKAIGTTWWVLLLSMLLTTFLALELSILFVKQRAGKWRKTLLPLLFITDRIPVFILALLLLIFLASPDFLQLFPVYGMGAYQPQDQHWLQRFVNLFPYMVLPVVCLVCVNLPYITNQFYWSLSDVSHADFIRTAKAKGLSERQVIRKHMLRNALFPIITLLSDFLPALVGGVVVIETIFAIPGIGRLLIESVQTRDYPVMVGVVLVVALFKVIAHFVSDIFYGLADPRIRQKS